MWVYLKQAGSRLDQFWYEVGFYDPSGNWIITETFWPIPLGGDELAKDAARDAVHYLNGGDR